MYLYLTMQSLVLIATKKNYCHLHFFLAFSYCLSQWYTVCGPCQLCPATSIGIKMWMLCRVCGNIYSAYLPWPRVTRVRRVRTRLVLKEALVSSLMSRGWSLRTLSAGQRVKVIRRAVTSLVICYSDCYKNNGVTEAAEMVKHLMKTRYI